MKTKSIFTAIAIILSAPANAQEDDASKPETELTAAQRESLCHSFADLGVAVIEAREAGVPIDQVLELIRSMPSNLMPSEESAEWLRNEARAGAMRAYAEPPIGRRPNALERQQLINRFTAECVLDWE
ncbi:hypothetical protein [Qipengyuania sp.]|uniref:hypothetical protein n=1 Tax=Qipengyuania sp. TaxID=2004515 RepID=UPI00373594D3